jgi:hypothetical protein
MDDPMTDAPVERLEPGRSPRPAQARELRRVQLLGRSGDRRGRRRCQ